MEMLMEVEVLKVLATLTGQLYYGGAALPALLILVLKGSSCHCQLLQLTALQLFDMVLFLKDWQPHWEATGQAAPMLVIGMLLISGDWGQQWFQRL